MNEWLELVATARVGRCAQGRKWRVNSTRGGCKVGIGAVLAIFEQQEFEFPPPRPLFFFRGAP